MIEQQVRDVFSNLSLRDGTVQNSLRDIFQAIAEYQKTKNVLALMNKFQTYDWLQEYEPIDYTMATMRQIIQPRAYVS